MNATEFVRTKAEGKAAAPVATLGDPLDYRAALLLDAARPHLQDVTPVTQNGAAVEAPGCVLACYFLVLEEEFVGGRQS